MRERGDKKGVKISIGKLIRTREREREREREGKTKRKDGKGN